MSKYNKGIRNLFCSIDLFSKYAWFVPLKGKKGISSVNAFKKIVSKGWKPNKVWVCQGGEFYNKKIEMYSAHNEGKSAVAERLVKTLKNKLFKHRTAISKNVIFLMH